MQRILAVLFLLTLAACTTLPSQDNQVVGPVVEGKKSGSTELQYLPFSNTTGEPVIATEAFVKANAISPAGGTMSGTLYVQSPATTVPDIWVRRSVNSNENAPKSLGLPSEYLRLGGGEWGVGSYRTIGFGYGGTGSNAPAAIGYQETNKSGNTSGNLIFATRNSTSNIAPSVRLSINADGNILAADGYTPPVDQSLSTKKYVDARSLSPNAITAIKALTTSSTVAEVVAALQKQ